jgi:hypothetical protein
MVNRVMKTQLTWVAVALLVSIIVNIAWIAWQLREIRQDPTHDAIFVIVPWWTILLRAFAAAIVVYGILWVVHRYSADSS